ncbi:MAG: MliC family protein, partial [Lysobacter sp.]
MTLPAATPRLTLSLAIVLLAVACQPDAGRDAPAPPAPATTEPAAPTPAPTEATATADTFHWQCGEVGVASTYLDDSKHVALAFSGRELELPIAVSGSGARYADDAGNEFWTKGDSGTLTLAAEAGTETAKRECTRSDRPSPWFQAAERGVGFRAGGGEPGWFVEVDRGENPALNATLDYADRTIEVARTAA